jgi:serine/threonine protein kinase/Tfp pilus assembly protein PilF
MDDSKHISELCEDQRRCWAGGDPVPVETYLRQRPALAADREAVLDLIYNEIYLRTEKGDRPQLDEYLRRFPHLADELHLQFDVHMALESDPVTRPTALDYGHQAEHAITASPGRGDRVPGYDILGELGRGGMGVVYRARDRELKRLVALKMILAGPHAGAGELARFRAEAEALARLQHPNIVQIHGVDVHDGCPYFSLELVEGESLKKHLEAGPLAFDRAAELAEALARAMHYAHQQGVVHRDLKPANVLLQNAECRLQIDDGIPHSAICNLQSAILKITDFGLAKFLDADGSSTTSGAFLGTPNYTSPEQAAGRAEAIGPATDIYAIGAVLYEMVTGRPPFQGLTPMATLEAVQTEEPLPPRQFRQEVPRDLEAICLKCLAKNPGERYLTALELADDLQRYRSGDAVRARPIPAWRRWLRSLRRRPVLRALLVLSAVLVPVLAAQQAWQWERGRRLRAREKYEEFFQRRDDVFFHGAFGTMYSDSDATRQLQETRTAAQQALALVNLQVEPDTPLLYDPDWTEAEREQVRSGCYQLLLVLADAVSKPESTEPPRSPHESAAAALAILQRAAQIGTPTHVYHLRRFRYLTQVGQVEEARQAWAQAQRLPAAALIDHLCIGADLLRDGKVSQAMAAFDKASREQSSDFWSRFFLGHCQLHLNQAANARETFTACLDRQPTSVWAYVMRAEANQQLRAFDEAEADYQDALKLKPSEDARYYLFVSRGRTRLQRGQCPEARSDLEQAHASKPDHYEACMYLARACRKEGKTAEAADWLDQARQRRVPDVKLAGYRAEEARQLFDEKQYAKAVQECDAALQLAPQLVDIHGLRGWALLRAGRFEAARAAFNDYLARAESPSPNVFRGRGDARMKLGDFAGAIADYNRAVDLANEPDAKLYLYRGWALFFTDAWKLARLDFDTAARLDTQDPEARIGRGLARVMLGQYREAATDAEEGLRRKPASAEMMHNTACIFAQAAARVRSDATVVNQAELETEYRRRAVDVLRLGVEMVPRNERVAFWRDKVRSDAALEPIRRSVQFQKLDREVTGEPEK